VSGDLVACDCGFRGIGLEGNACPACFGAQVDEEYARLCATARKTRAHLEYGPGGGQRIVDVKVGRNDPCPCGSGRKHKKCCG
jgi:preprotein translocase subunit SecA